MKPFDAGRVPPITFGVGRLTDTAEIIAAFSGGMNSIGHGGPVLLVADAILAELGPVAELVLVLERAGIGVEVAADIIGEPKEALIDALAERARRTKCQTVIGLGGGAAMDAAKLVAAIVGSDRPCGDYALGAIPFPAKTLNAIAIPTTAGTGSEVTRTSIVSTADGLKYWYWDEALMFDHVVLDPALTLTLPAHITAWTGIDAVAHALEAATSRKSDAVGRLFGFQALEILACSLPRSVERGDDIDARGQTLWGATVAGLALHNCNTHMGHNISHALGSLAPIHHGLATGLALEVTLPTLVSRPEGNENYARAAEAMGVPGYAASLPKAFSDLMRSCGIARGLPKSCAAITAPRLAELMKAPANIGMAENAACEMTSADLDAFASQIVALPVMEKAA